MRGAEIAGVEQFGIGQPLAEIAMAIGAELLRRRRHLPRAFMLGMAFDAASLRNVESAGKGKLDLTAQPRRSLGTGKPLGIGMIVNIGVAGGAGIVAHRDEGFGVTGLTIIFERLVRERQLAAGPGLIGVEARRTGLHILVRRPAPQRKDEEAGKHQADKAPGADPLAGQDAREREDLLFVLIFRRIGQGLDTFDREDDGAILERDRGTVAAEAQFCTARGVDFGAGALLAIDIDARAVQRTDRDMTIIDPRNLRMAQRYAEIGEMDVARGIAADGKRAGFNAIVADDFTPVRRSRNLPDQKAHGRITNRRRQRRCAPTTPQ